MSGVPASADVFRAVADPTRRALLDLLRKSDCSVGELRGSFRMTQPAISQHLRVLRRAGLVRARQVGRKRLYRLNPKPLLEVYDWAAQYKQFSDPFGHVWALRTANDDRAPLPGPAGGALRRAENASARQIRRSKWQRKQPK